jgi:hypothetical protein
MRGTWAPAHKKVHEGARPERIGKAERIRYCVSVNVWYSRSSACVCDVKRSWRCEITFRTSVPIDHQTKPRDALSIDNTAAVYFFLVLAYLT